MNYNVIRFGFLFYMIMAFSNSSSAQSWEFIKEKEGIKIYTRKETGKSVKSYKGITEINAPAEKVYAMIEDVNHTDWWDKNLNQIKVLVYEKDKRAQYYLVYDLPWPVTDRDLCVNVTVTIDQATGVRKIIAGPLPGLMPEVTGMVRIKDYRQTWTIKPTGKGTAHVELEGCVDPAGSIPDWLSNMVIVDSPLKVIGGVKQQMEK